MRFSSLSQFNAQNFKNNSASQKLAQMKEQLAKLKEQRSKLIEQSRTGSTGAQTEAGNDRSDIQDKIGLNGDGHITPLEALTYSRRAANASVKTSTQDSTNTAFYTNLSLSGLSSRKR